MSPELAPEAEAKASVRLNQKGKCHVTAPLYTVVIPVYNREHLVEKTLRSVLEQSCQDFEIVVVDDGSRDRPQDVIAKLADERIRFIRQENAGGGAARNNGILNARGRYIALLDSDDLFLPDKLEKYAK